MLLWPMISFGYTLASFQRASAAMGAHRGGARRRARGRGAAAGPGASGGRRPGGPGRLPGGARDLRPRPDVPLSRRRAARRSCDVSIEVPAGSTLAVVGPVALGQEHARRRCSRGSTTRPRAPSSCDGIDVTRAPAARAARRASPSCRRTASSSPTRSARTSRSASRRRRRPDGSRRRPAAAGLADDLAAFPQRPRHDRRRARASRSRAARSSARRSRARCCATRPILVIDDALSAVDTRTEARILDGLRRERAGRTAIVTAHRLSTIRDADQIVVLDGGTRRRARHARRAARGRRLVRAHVAAPAPPRRDRGARVTPPRRRRRPARRARRAPDAVAARAQAPAPLRRGAPPPRRRDDRRDGAGRRARPRGAASSCGAAVDGPIRERSPSRAPRLRARARRRRVPGLDRAWAPAVRDGAHRPADRLLAPPGRLRAPPAHGALVLRPPPGRHARDARHERRRRGRGVVLERRRVGLLRRAEARPDPRRCSGGPTGCSSSRCCSWCRCCSR